MIKNIRLDRPLAVLDLETTGTSFQEDRIVEISVLKILPDGKVDHRTRRFNPGIPIPADATAVHGITDADVADKPSFADYADSFVAFLDGCDLCGFNIKRFDLRLLQVELSRVNLSLPLDDKAIVDAMEIFHAYERRDLSAAVQFYCGKEHKRSHAASADVLATVEVLDAMMARYSDLPRSITLLHQKFKDPNAVDQDGRFVRVQGQICFAFGKHKSQLLETIAQTNRDYLEWMLTEDFLDDVKRLVKDALNRSPTGPSSPPVGRHSLRSAKKP